MYNFSRRQFVHLSSASLAASYFLHCLPASGGSLLMRKDLHFQEVIDMITTACGDPIANAIENQPFVNQSSCDSSTT